MKTKVLLLALLSGFVFSVSAQEFKPQVGFSNEAGYKTNFKKNKAGDNWFISIAGGASVLFGDQNSEADFKNRLNFEIQGMIIFIRIWIYFNMIHEVFQYKITERRDGKAVRI